jgi:hypothetical protein
MAPAEVTRRERRATLHRSSWLRAKPDWLERGERVQVDIRIRAQLPVAVASPVITERLLRSPESWRTIGPRTAWRPDIRAKCEEAVMVKLGIVVRALTRRLYGE